ncbi:MAG: hypothetical protein R6W91_00060 [Thermoplasmata archaeon]
MSSNSIAPDSDSVKEIGDLWDRQDAEDPGFDYARYNSPSWVMVKTFFAVAMMSLVFLLYSLHELRWTLFGSGTGILILAMMPFFAGLILGFTFENPKLALLYSILIGFISIGICMALMMLPKMLGLAEYGPGFMRNVWFYGFFVPFIVTISFVPAGTMVSVSTNIYE